MIRRTDSSGDVIHFFKIKDLLYFKELLIDYDLSIAREFLQSNIEIVQLSPFVEYIVQNGYRFIPSQNVTLYRGSNKQPLYLREGQAFSLVNEVVESEDVLLLYRISLKTQRTLRQLYYLDIPIVADIKCSQRLSFYGKCTITDLNYGTFVYRKGESVEAIYYVLEGQVKIYKKRSEQLIELNTIDRGKMFGLYCLKHGKQTRELIARSAQNGTKVLVIFKDILDQLCKEKDISLEKLFQNVKSELFSITRNKSIKKRQEDIENQKREREKTFEKRIRGFQEERNLKNQFLSNLAQNKTLLIKIRDLNASVRKKTLKQKTELMKNATDIGHSRFKIIYHKKCSSGQQQLPSTTRDSTGSRGILRSLVGLVRYPSVQKYLRLSRGDDEWHDKNERQTFE